MDEGLELQDKHWHVVVAPALGGSLLTCAYDGIPVLQPTLQPERIGLPELRCCHFPLIPFSNRIANGRFQFRGAHIRLDANVAGSSHALHGHGWLAAWRVDERSGTSCTLSYRHASASDWPWPYEGRQVLALIDGELRLTLAIENLGTTGMPCGLGFHPFLPAARDARLMLQATRVWDGPAGAFPSRRIAVPDQLEFSNGPRVQDRQGTDHCFDGWQGGATVSYGEPSRTIVLAGCEATHSVIVYVPDDADYFCVEPVTHAVDAFNLPQAAESGLWVLEPHETRQIAMSIGCQVT